MLIIINSLWIFAEDGQVYSWGFGNLGRGIENNLSDLPLPIPKPLFGKNAINENSKVSNEICFKDYFIKEQNYFLAFSKT